MKKIILTILVMIYIFALGMFNAKVHSEETTGGFIVTRVEVFGFEFEYWEEI